jgi:hypothetical protein
MIINIPTTHQIIIQPAFFLAESSVAVTKPITLPTIMKNKIQITKYSATFMKGYITALYKLSANCIQLGLFQSELANSFVIIQSVHTRAFAINLADTIIIIHNIPNITSLIPSFIVSSFSDVIILYHPINATTIHITMKKSITYHIITLTCSLNKSDQCALTTSHQFIAEEREVSIVDI